MKRALLILVSLRYVQCAIHVCRNSQFNTKDPYITASRSIQIKKVRSVKFIIPFRVLFKGGSHATKRILSFSIIASKVLIRQRANLIFQYLTLYKLIISNET